MIKRLPIIKRIEELSEQANAWRPGGYPSGEGGDKAWKDVVIFENEEDLQKFAELIVKECMNVCREQRDPQNLNYKPSERFAEHLRFHFGLEE